MHTDNAHRYEALDGLRGVAALTVMAGHFGQLLDIFWLPNTLLAVDTFFVLSGFVIAHSYGERLRRGMSAWSYLYRRVVRLYPMFVACLLIGAAVLYYGAHSGAIAYRTDDILRSVVLNTLYIPFFNDAHIYFLAGEIFPADPPAWSLFFEMLASGAFLLLFGLRLRALIMVPLLWYVVLIVAGRHYAAIDGNGWIDIHNGYSTQNILGGLPRAGFGFSLGVVLQALARKGVAARHIDALVERIPYPSFVLYAVLLAMLLCPKSLHGLYPLVVLATAAPAIVFVGAHIRLRAGWERNLALSLGWISYPVYCLHYPIGRLAKFLGVGTHDPGYLPMGAGIAVTLAAAMALTRWYEEPVRAALSARRWRGVEGAVPK